MINVLGIFAGIGIAVTAVALYRLGTVGLYLFVRWAWKPRR